MIDTHSRKRLAVVAGEGRPHVVVPVARLPAVEALLRDNQVDFWTDSSAISINGNPQVIYINFGSKTNPQRIQQLLDAVD